MSGYPREKSKVTYICFDIFVLQVEGVFPDVNANDRNVRKKRVLIRSCGYRQSLGFRIDALANERVTS